MKTKLFQSTIFVRKSPKHGYGVTAGKSFKKGELIEECYMIITKGGDSVLEDYYFDAGRNKYAVFTGFGMIYNHDENPNADYTLKNKMRVVTFKASRRIKKGEEITVSYGDKWFSSRGEKCR